nr:aminoacyl--tRNA ligase-related protein [Mycobacterium tuberculosis]
MRGLTHGRRAHLLHPRPDARRAAVAAAVCARPARPTTASPTSTSNCPPRTRRSSSAPRRSGRKPPPCWPRWAAESGLELVPDPGGAAFYGPKISVQVQDALGRTWQMSTIQLDFNFPERFGLEYTAADGTRHRPVMIHRALFGSIERFFGILTEALRGGVPGLVGARAGGRHPGRR